MTSFEDLHSYVSIPRVTGLRLSPDGTWLAATVQQPDPDGTKFSTSIWRIPAAGPGGQQPVGSATQPARLNCSRIGKVNPSILAPHLERTLAAAFAVSTSRSRGRAVVTRQSRSSREACAT